MRLPCASWRPKSIDGPSKCRWDSRPSPAAQASVGSDGFSPEEDDCFELYRLSFIAHLVCSITWNLLAVGYCVFCFVQPLAQPDSLFADPAVPVAFFCTFEVLSKVLFLSTLVEAYESVFDETRRTIRHRRFKLEKQLIQ